ncbi:hypothetical protein [Flavihumibacter petaseus]|uniref:DUF4412 domain-containing protein n=1 Tax=Flavihumibacter petaseus NBRC 106054 TaxID=1220578 RepID=A0A0E9N0U7_9BACT|nr:hypothetical protein [Flavihumibacter petaseus]GAO43383.1 hypothetical protein FPE01S_02_04880 [Flavihumibacter petaseus NBRC 106054]
MKRMSFLLTFIWMAFVAFAQDNKFDVVTKINGDELTGTVQEISQDVIKFVYKNEKLVYTFKKSEIFKIKYASGRSEVFTTPGQSAPAQPAGQQAPVAAPAGTPLPTSTPEERHSKVGVLPFTYLKDSRSSGEDMEYKVQRDVYNYLVGHAPMYKIVDPRTINATLLKAGITNDKLRAFTMQELCEILGVEFVVSGTVDQKTGTATTYSSDTYNQKNKDDKSSGSASSTTTSSQKIETNVTVAIFNDKNDNVYNKTHQQFLGSTDGSYLSTIEYIMKRSPLYQK